MNEYLQQYLDGKIDYATYLQYAGSNSTNDVMLESLSNINRREKITGTGRTGDLSKSFNMDDEELSTYTDRGITPVSGSDYEDTRAELQGWDEQLANGVVKFAGKTATGVVGGLAMLPGLLAPLVTGEFSSIYDNAFQRSLDQANEAMDEALPNYVTREEEKNNFLENAFGTMNFWANDMLGAASFVAGAIGAEFLSAGAYTAAIPGKVAKTLKQISYAEKMGKIGLLSKQAGRLNNINKAGNLARQVVTGAGYEAGVEARGFIDEAETNYINKFTEENGREPNDEELASAMNEIRSSANGLFAANLALVSAGNIITLPRFFGPGIKGLENSKSKWLSNVDDLSEDQLARVARNKNMSIEDVKKLKTVNKFDTFSKGRKALSYGYQALEKPVAEGLIEEGGQSFMNKTALDYIDAKLFNDTTEDTASLVDSMAEGFKQTYGGDSNDFWKEVFIGSLMGGISGFKLPNKKAKTGFGYDVTNYSKDVEVNKLVDLSNNLQYSKEVFASANRQAQLNNRLENAIAVGDDFEAKNIEDQITHDFVTNKIKLGQFDQIEDEVAKEVRKMSDEEFAAEYGYENLSKEELSKRKNEVVNNFVKNAKDIQKNYALANKSNYTGNSDVTDGLSYVLFMGDRIDNREDALAEEFNGKIGKLYNARVMKAMAKFIDFQNTKAKEKIATYESKVNELEKLTQEELAANNNRTSSEIMERGKKLDALAKEVSSLEKQLEQDYHSFLKEKGYVRKGKTLEYGKDSVIFKQELNEFLTKQKEVEDKTGKDIFKRPDVETIINDLNRLAKFRESQITTANYFFTKEGQKSLQSQVDRLKTLKEQARITDELEVVKQKYLAEKADYEKMEKLAAESYAYKYRKHLGEVEINNKIKEGKEKIKDSINDILSTQLPEEVKKQLVQALENLQALLTVYDTIESLEKKEEYLKNVISPAVKDFMNVIDIQEVIYPQIAVLKNTETFKRIKELVNSIKPKGEIAPSITTPVNANYKYLQSMQWTPEAENLKNEVLDLENNISIKIEKETFEKESEDFVNPNNTIGGEMLGTGVKVAVGVPEIKERLNDKDKKVKYSVKVYYKGQHIGYLNTPDKYRFGNTLDTFNGSLEQLEMLNPAYVETKDGNKKISYSGELFVNTYKQAKNNFNILLDKFTTDNKTEFSPKEVKEIFDINFDYSGIEKTSPISINELGDFADGAAITNLSDVLSQLPDGIPNKGIIVYNEAANSYYLYDPTNKKGYEIPKEYNNELATRFEPTLKKVSKSGNFNLVALYEINGKPLFQAFQDKTIDSQNLDFGNLLEQDLQTIITELNKLKDAKALGEKFDESKGLISFANSINLSKYRFTSQGRSYKLNLIVKKDNNDNPYIEFTLAVKTADADKYTNITLGFFNSNGKNILYNDKAKGVTSTGQKILPSYLAFNLSSKGFRFGDKDIKNGNDFIKYLNERISSTLTYSESKVKQGQANDYITTNLINLSQGQEKDGKQIPASIQAVKLNFSQSEVVDFLPEFETTSRPQLRITFTKNSDMISGELEASIELANKADKKQPLKVLEARKNGLTKAWDNSNQSTQQFYRTKYDTTLKHINNIIEELSNLGKPATTPAQPTPSKDNTLPVLESGVDWDSFFFTSDTKFSETENIAEKQARLMDILPEWITVKNIEDIKEGLSKTGFTYGMFKNSVIYLSSSAPKGVEYHEAFHAVFRVLLSDVQVAKVLSDAKTEYGIPSKEQLKELKNKSTKYESLTNEQLSNLWYEEKLADSFMDYMNNKKPDNRNFIQKMFDKIINFIKDFLGMNPVIDSLFEDISKGEFKNSSPKKKSIITPNVEVFNSLINNDNTVIDPYTARNIISKLFFQAMQLKDSFGVVTTDDIIGLIKTFKEEQLHVGNFVTLLEDLKLQDAAQADLVQTRIQSLYDNIDNERNKQVIVNEIKNKLDTYKFFEIDTLDEDVQDDRPLELVQKPHQQLGGIESLSKKLKNYIMFTPMVSDMFGFQMSQEKMEALVDNPDTPLSVKKSFVNYVDGYALHAGLERMLVNSSREDLLPKMYELTQENPEVKAFYQRLVTDIYKDLNKDITPDIFEEAPQLSINELSASTYFRMFVAGYNKHKIESIINRYDVEAGNSKVHRSNLNDVQDNQMKLWYSNFKRSNFFTYDKTDITQVLNKIDSNLKVLPANFEKAVQTVKENMEILSINLSEKYIELSILHNSIANFQDVNPDSKIGKLLALYNSYKDIEYLTPEIVNAIKSSIKFNSNGKIIAHHFAKKSEDLEKDLDIVSDNIDENELEVSNLGAVSRIKEIALGNSMFNIGVYPSTFTNVNNEKVYTHLYPNYITTLALIFRNNVSENDLSQWIDSYSYEDGKKAFTDFLIKNKLSSSFSDDLIIDVYYRQIRNNPLFNNKDVREVFVNNFEAFINDGLKVQDFEKTFKGIEFAESYYGLDARGKLIFLLNQFAENPENNLRRDFQNAEDKTVKTYVQTLFQNEGKNTQYSFRVPQQYYVDNGGLTQKAYDAYSNLLKGELERVSNEYQNIINEKGIIQDFNFITNEKLQKSPFKTKQEIIDALKDPSNKEAFFQAASLFKGLKLTHFEILKNINNDIYQELIFNAITGNTTFNIQPIADELFKYHTDELISFMESKEVDMLSEVKKNVLPSFYKKDNGVDKDKIKNFLANYFINSASVNQILFGDLNATLKDSTDLVKRMAGPAAAGPALGFGESNIAVVKDITNSDTKFGDINTTDAQSQATIWWYMNQYLPTNGKWNSDIEAIYEKILKMEDLNENELIALQETGNLLNPRKTSAFAFNFYGKTSTAILTRKEVSYVSESDKEEFDKEVVKLLPSSNLKYGTKAFQDQVLKVQKFYKPFPGSQKLHDLLNKMENGNIDLVFFESAVKSIKFNIQDINNPSLNSFAINNEFIREQVITDSVKDEIIHGTQLMQLVWSEQLDNNLKVNFNNKETTIGELRKAYKGLLGWRVDDGMKKLKKAILEDGKAKYDVLIETFKQSILEQGGDPALLELFSKEHNFNNPRTLNMYEKMFLAFVSKTVFSRKTAGHKFTLRTGYGSEVIRDNNGRVISREQIKLSPEKYANYPTSKLKFEQDSNNPNVYYAECKIPIQIAKHLNITEDGFISSKLAEMLGIRIPTQDKHSMVYLKVVELLPAELGPQIIMPDEIINLSGADFDIDSEFARIFDSFISGDSISIFGNYLIEEDPDLASSEYLESMSNSKEVKTIFKKELENHQEYQRLLAERDHDIKLKKGKDKYKKFLASEELKEITQKLNAIKFNVLSNVLKSYGYASTPDEFKIRYSKIVENNIKNYKAGKVSEIIPITLEEANNHLLDIEKSFVMNSAIKEKVSEKPATDTKAKKFMKDFYTEIEDPLLAVDYSTPQAVVKASNANAIGQQNIGIAALANIMFQYFKDNNVEIKDLGVMDSFTNESNERINDLISTVITMAVDNAKEQYAIRFNLTPATQSVFVSMLMLKKDFDYVSAMMVQPALLEYSAAKAFDKSPIKTKREEDSLPIFSELLVKYQINKDVADVYPDGISYEVFKKAKLYSQKVANNQPLTEDDLTEEQFKAVQLYSIKEFAKYDDKTKSFFSFSRVISLIKGLPSELGEAASGIKDEVEKLGIEVYKTDNGNFAIKNTLEYENDPDKFPIDYKSIFENDSFLKAELFNYYRFNDLLDQFFLSQTSFAKELFDDIKINIKYINNEDYNKIVRLINGYLTIQAFNKKYNNNEESFKYSDIVSDTDTETSLVNTLKKLRKSTDPIINNNDFLKTLDYDKVKYENKETNSLNNKTTYTLKIDSFSKLSPEQSLKLIGSYSQLFKHPDKEVSGFAQKLFQHILSKDLIMYRNNSYVSSIPTNLMRVFTGILNDAHLELLKDSPNYQSVFGKSKQELIEDFSEKFTRDISNKMMIKGNKMAAIGKLIKNALQLLYFDLPSETQLYFETPDMKNTPIGKAVQKLISGESFTVEDYESLSPIEFTENGFKINLFKNFGVVDELGLKKFPKGIIQFNKDILFATRLFSKEYIRNEKTKGKIYTNILFPKALSISKGDSPSRIAKRTKLTKGDKTVSNNQNSGIAAEYEFVNSIGSKLLLPYAFNLKDIDAKIEIAKEPKKIEEKTEILTKVEIKNTATTKGAIDYININDALLKKVYESIKDNIRKFTDNTGREIKINSIEELKTFIKNVITTGRAFAQKSDEVLNATLNKTLKTSEFSTTSENNSNTTDYSTFEFYESISEKLKVRGIADYAEYLKLKSTMPEVFNDMVKSCL